MLVTLDVQVRSTSLHFLSRINSRNCASDRTTYSTPSMVCLSPTLALGNATIVNPPRREPFGRLTIFAPVSFDRARFARELEAFALVPFDRARFEPLGAMYTSSHGKIRIDEIEITSFFKIHNEMKEERRKNVRIASAREHVLAPPFRARICPPWIHPTRLSAAPGSAPGPTTAASAHHRRPRRGPRRPPSSRCPRSHARSSCPRSTPTACRNCCCL